MTGIFMSVGVPALPGSGRAMTAWPAAGFLAATVIASLFFRRFPEVDLAVSAYFYRPGDGFPLARDPALQLLRSINLLLPHLCLAAAVAALIAHGAGRWPAISRRIPAPSRCLFLLGVLGLGPGVLARLIKDGIGRARPREIFAFGGNQPFSLPWDVSRACSDNCSFISGEGASAAALMALPLLLPEAYRMKAYAIVAPFAVAVSLSRVAFGAHFLSDVVIAWCLMFTLIGLLLSLEGRWRGLWDATLKISIS